MTKRVAYLVFAGLLLCIILLIFTGCAEKTDVESGSNFNYQIFDVTYAYDKAIIKLPDGKVVEGKVNHGRTTMTAISSRSRSTARPIWSTPPTASLLTAVRRNDQKSGGRKDIYR